MSTVMKYKYKIMFKEKQIIHMSWSLEIWCKKELKSKFKQNGGGA